MKRVAFLVSISGSIAFGAAGPLQVGNFSPYVSQTATRKINLFFIPQAIEKNGGTLPSGSVASMWDELAKKGVIPYYEEHTDQLAASSDYTDAANNNEIVQGLYERASQSTAPSVVTRKILWEAYLLNATLTFAPLEQKNIPRLNLSPVTIVGIMVKNQDLEFTPSEKISFGGAIAATVSIMQLIYKQDPDVFNRMFQEWIPTSSDPKPED